MVFGHFNETQSVLPTPNQILYGIILAQIYEFKNDGKNNDNFSSILDVYSDVWKKIFSLAKTVDMKKPLTQKILSNPDHEFVKLLIYIYSMESFIFKEMNRTSRIKDESNIKFYGAFASALGYIIHCGNKN